LAHLLLGCHNECCKGIAFRVNIVLRWHELPRKGRADGPTTLSMRTGQRVVGGDVVGRKAIPMGVLRRPQKRRDLVRTHDVLPGLWLPARTRCPQVGNNPGNLVVRPALHAGGRAVNARQLPETPILSDARCIGARRGRATTRPGPLSCLGFSGTLITGAPETTARRPWWLRWLGG
jgi:hypothetical protein